MTCQKSHHLPCDYSLFPPVLTLITALTLITVCFVVLLLMPFPGVPLTGRAVVNGASEAVSALTGGFAPIFPDICYHLTHYKPAAADIPVASDNPAHYADAIRYNARTPLQGSLLPLTRLVWA